MYVSRIWRFDELNSYLGARLDIPPKARGQFSHHCIDSRNKRRTVAKQNLRLALPSLDELVKEINLLTES